MSRQVFNYFIWFFSRTKYFNFVQYSIWEPHSVLPWLACIFGKNDLVFLAVRAGGPQRAMFTVKEASLFVRYVFNKKYYLYSIFPVHGWYCLNSWIEKWLFRSFRNQSGCVILKFDSTRGSQNWVSNHVQERSKLVAISVSSCQQK